MSEQFGGDTPLAVGLLECYNSILYKIQNIDKIDTKSSGGALYEVTNSHVLFPGNIKRFLFIYFYNRSCWSAFCISSENKMIEVFLNINK